MIGPPKADWRGTRISKSRMK